MFECKREQSEENPTDIFTSNISFCIIGDYKYMFSG